MRYLSVFDSDGEIISALDDIFLKNQWIDLDCTYSKGVFYNEIKEPRIKSDLIPLFTDVVEADSRELKNIKDNSLNSIVFDPPFLFRNRKSANTDKICARFSYFKSYEELLDMYFKSLVCFKSKLKKNGYLFFKCQDMTDGKFYCTHNDIINYATNNGYILKDIVIKKSKSKLQRDAVQQNCVAKIHSFWLVLQNVERFKENLYWNGKGVK